MRWFWRVSGQWALLSALLREGVIVKFLFAFAFVYLLLSFFEITIWRCPLRMMTGLRCPGCGLTTGSKAFLRGNFVEAVTWNWLVPVILLGMLFSVVVLAMPKPQRERFLAGLERFEKRSRLLLVGVAFVLLQTLARMLGWA